MATYDSPRPSSQPVGSTDPAVVKDDLITLDKITTSTETTVTNRKGGVRKTMLGLEVAAQDTFRLGAGVPQGDYVGGVSQYDESNWTFTYNGQQWGLSGDFDLSALPYLTTEADPNNDANLAVRGSASQEYVQTEITRGQGENISGKIFPTDDDVLDDGMIVPAGTTHLRVLIDGEPTIVSMSPAASGVVSLLTEVGATIGGAPVDFTSIRFGKFSSVENAKSAIGIKIGDYVETYKYYDDLNGGAAVYQLVTPAEFGGTPDELADHTHLSGNILKLVYSNPVSIEQCGARSIAAFDSTPSFLSAWAKTNVAIAEKASTYYLASELVYPGNAHEFHGAQSAPYSSNTILAPMNNTFAAAGLIDMNENGSDSGLEGGQYNKLVNVTVYGGMADFNDSLDPLVNLVGVRGLNTRNETAMINVSFRACGKPFDFTGYQIKHKKLDVYQCHTAGDMNSNGSSVIDDYNILTCNKNWGSMTGVEIRNAVLQQGNDQQTLVDNRGMTCDGIVNFTGSFYTEGGNAQIYVSDGATATIQNPVLGFAILAGGGYGNYNIRVGADSSIIINGGESVDTKSFVVGGTPSAARNIHLDIEENDNRLFDFADATQLPNCENLFVRRSYATIKRKNGYSEITYNTYQVDVSTVTVWNQFTTTTNFPFGGEIDIQVTGTNTYDKYNITFVDAPSETEQVTINTIYRNTGGTGDNNVIMSYSAPNLTLQGRKSPQRFGMTVKGWGNIWPKPIA